MAKLSAIARYELLMAWRRRSLPILWIVLLAGVVGFSLLIASVSSGGMTLAQIVGRNANLPASVINTIPLINVMVAGALINCVSITLMLCETIPLDRQFKLRELLDALPVSRAVYLGGKLLGMWGGLVLGWALAGVICPAALYLIFGAYDLRVIGLLWVAALLPTALLAAALSVLAGALVGSRRMAVLVGLIALPFVLFLVALGIPAFFNLGGLIDPIYALDASSGTSPAAILALYAGVILALWTLVWAVMRAQDAR